MDALVALVVLSTTIALALQAADTARRAARQAAEMRRAEALMRHLLDGPVSTPGTRKGAAGELDWRVVVTASAAGASSETRICELRVELRGRASRRAYVGQTVEVCPPPIEGARP